MTDSLARTGHAEAARPSSTRPPPRSNPGRGVGGYGLPAVDRGRAEAAGRGKISDMVAHDPTFEASASLSCEIHAVVDIDPDWRDDWSDDECIAAWTDSRRRKRHVARRDRSTLTLAEQRVIADRCGPCPACQRTARYNVHPKPIGIGENFMENATVLVTCECRQNQFVPRSLAA